MTESLIGGEIHLWRIDLCADSETMAAFEATLSFDELARADRFHFARDRDRFVVGRGALRTILARYLPDPADELCFVYGAQGKPSLADDKGLSFNLSHSHDAALLAVTAHREIGVDIERIRTDWDLDAVAREVFSPAECADLSDVGNPSERAQLFFRYWTLKEAYVKALGAGLLCDTRAFTITPDADSRATIANSADPRPWRLQTIDIDDDYTAALAVEADKATSSVRVLRRQFDPVPVDERREISR